MRALADTGASLSVLPERITEELEIEAESVDEVATRHYKNEKRNCMDKTQGLERTLNVCSDITKF